MIDSDWTLREHGVERCPDAVDANGRAMLLDAIGRVTRGAPHARRGLLWDLPGFAERLRACGLDALAARFVPGAFPIHALYFDKNTASNWTVSAHQDVVMPFAESSDEDGFTRWTTKGDVPHAAPPAAVLATLVALRVHFDDCGPERGPLAVLPGSHRDGVLADDAIGRLSLDRFRPCLANAGDVVAMRPLTVHRSSRAAVPERRRVLHVVYAGSEPGARVRWRRP